MYNKLNYSILRNILLDNLRDFFLILHIHRKMYILIIMELFLINFFIKHRNTKITNLRNISNIIFHSPQIAFFFILIIIIIIFIFNILIISNTFSWYFFIFFNNLRCCCCCCYFFDYISICIYIRGYCI
jgi:hypothetical protein